MTYPQPPYGQQPDPYGQGQQPGQYGGGYQQPPTGGQPQQGGYPQTGGQPQQGYPGYDPTAQYPNPQYPNTGYQTAQYGGFPGGQYGGYGPPPPKKKTGMIVAVVAIVVLLLGGLGITGFVAPGFFLSDHKTDASGGGGQTTSADNGAAADGFIDELVKAADEKDSAALQELSCKDATDNVDQAIKDIDDIEGAKLKDTKEVSDSEVTAVLDITVGTDSADFEATVVKDGSDWCWNDIQGSGGSSLPTGPSAPEDTATPPSGGSGGGGTAGAAQGEAFVQDFLDTLNGGDAAGAKSKLCKDSTSQTDIDDAVAGKANLQMDTANKEAQEQYVGVDLKGTLKGAPTSAARTSAFLKDGGWCIFTFYAF